MQVTSTAIPSTGPAPHVPSSMPQASPAVASMLGTSTVGPLPPPASAPASAPASSTYVTRHRMSGGAGSGSGPSLLPKPRTPRGSGHTPNGHASGPASQTFKASPSEVRRKPTYTSSMHYPDVLPAPTFFNPTPAPTSAANGEEGELQRSQRRSKQQALGKIDRAGTPIQITSGPTATSFLPPSAQGQGQQTQAGPSAAKNPLHRPVIVNPPFSADSVRQEAPRHLPPRTGRRAFGLEECPVYYPTEAEFQDTMGYIASISDEAKAYGICKIVPPEGWKMPFTMEPETFRFRTRLQRLNQLEAASRAKINFLEQLSMFHNQSTDTEVTIPKIDRQPLDLWTLRKEVNKAGGHFDLDRTKTWTKITEALGHKTMWTPHIRHAYMTIVLPFDKWALRAKSASVSPLTPLANGHNGTRPPPAFAADAPPSPSQARSSGRMGPTSNPSPRTRMSSRMSGGQNGHSLELPHSHSAPLLGVNGLQAAAEIDRSASVTPTTAATALSIKVPGFATRDGSESELSEEDSELSEDSPKKQKKVRTPEYQKGEVCEVCRGGHAADKILLCDGCDRGFHTYCLDPPLTAVPTNEEWFCNACLLSQGDDFGFEEGEDHSIASFQARDSSFSWHWWNRHKPPVASASTTSPGKPVLANGSSALPLNGAAGEDKPDPLVRHFGKVSVTEDDVEREFWRLTESSTDTVDVEYGADVHSTTHGSAGPTLETHPLNSYSADGWNLNNMPILPDSLLRYIRSDISGMTVPWIYLGMMFSTFCWHNEDHYTYSVNYMYWGETKTWYGIPGSDAEKFEQAMKSEAPELFEQQPGLLFQLVTMMNPGRVRDAGVKVVACDQRPNEFVITFPKAYHCGFNHGLNMNEAVNFALPDWLADGKESVLQYKAHAKHPVFSHNELLIAITLYSETIRTAIWLKESLTQMVVEENRRRDKLRLTYPMLTETQVEEDGAEESYQCAVCKAFCYLAQVTCACTSLVACLDHADQLCACSKSKRSLRKRYTEAQLEEILAIVVARASLPDHWKTKLYALLESPRPALKSMRTLVAEGEKIAYPLPEVHSLRAMVDRANVWVEKVSALTTRKTAARRRKGRKEEMDEDDLEPDRNPQALAALLAEADKLAFDAPEIHQLKQSLLSIQSFQSEAAVILSTDNDEELELEKCKTVLILGESLNLDLPEITAITTVVNRLTWFRKVEEEVDDRTLDYDETVKLLQQAEEYEVPEWHPTVYELQKRRGKGEAWLRSVDALLSAPSIQIADISALIEGHELVPVSVEKMRQLENIRKTVLGWQASAKNFLSSNGSALAAARLCKNVSTASSPINRVDIPEIAELQGELDVHTLWQEKAASLLEVPANKVAATIKYLEREFESHLAEEDDEPSDDFACYCRAPPGAIMVTCQTCLGEYHPKCANVIPKNAALPYQCDICQRILPGDAASLNEFATLVTSERWQFKITPPEFAVASNVVKMALRYAPTIFTLVDPLNLAESVRDVERIRHAIRKIYTLPLLFDAVNIEKGQRIVFASWLFRRMQDAIKFHAGLLVDASGEAVTGPKEKTRTRGRKPRFVMARAAPREFQCICSEYAPAEDPSITLDCMKCGQGYHASCVKAPAEAVILANSTEPTDDKRKAWRCPCCTIKEAKHYVKGVELRVQLPEQVGTNDYVDYRATILNYAEAPVMITLPPSNSAVTMLCARFIPPILPEDFGRPRERDGLETNGDVNGSARKRRKVRPSETGLDNGVAYATPANPTQPPAASPHKHNGYKAPVMSGLLTQPVTTSVNGVIAPTRPSARLDAPGAALSIDTAVSGPLSATQHSPVQRQPLSAVPGQLRQVNGRGSGGSAMSPIYVHSSPIAVPTTSSAAATPVVTYRPAPPAHAPISSPLVTPVSSAVHQAVPSHQPADHLRAGGDSPLLPNGSTSSSATTRDTIPLKGASLKGDGSNESLPRPSAGSVHTHDEIGSPAERGTFFGE
ncbi:hypothetical protein IAU60_001436 [Kwoniella sp. DSM 27419]